MTKFWPATLAGRTALVLILALMAVQGAGLTIHALDRVELQRAASSREAAVRSFTLWRGLVLAAPERRAAVLADADPAELSWSLVVDGLIFNAEAEIRWLDHCEARVARAAREQAVRGTAPEADAAPGSKAGPAVEQPVLAESDRA